MGRKKEKASYEERHGSTCMCRRCRSRYAALNRERAKSRKLSYRDFLEDDDD